MELGELYLLHWRGEHVASAPAPEPRTGRDLFLIDTCQRRVVLGAGQEAIRAARGELPPGPIELFDGVQAYAFLLRFACGLESRLVAETEVFGQVKQAWRDFAARGSPLARRLSPWIQRLFQDAKAIRAQHLGHLGSASYGSQVRRLLPADAGPVLLVGAGQLAQSVAPWLGHSVLWICNRSVERAQALARTLERGADRTVRIIESGTAAELAAWRDARHAVVCIPADATLDAARVAAWREQADRDGRLIHLGLGAAEPPPPWDALAGLLSLGALFDMLRSQSQLRERAVQRARQACQEKAVLRSLGTGASHEHSWEDLAAFQNI